MSDAKKSVKLCIIFTNLFIALLVFIVIFLPFGVSWYVETMHRSEKLPATIMVTCYPCAPFLGIALVMLRRILKRISADRIYHSGNSHDLMIITYCCLIISVITLIAGRFYLPFYIVGGTFLFLALVGYSLRTVFRLLSEKFVEKEAVEEAKEKP